MNFSGECVQVESEGALAWVTIDNPPANVITTVLFGELATLAEELAAARSPGAASARQVSR